MKTCPECKGDGGFCSGCGQPIQGCDCDNPDWDAEPVECPECRGAGDVED